MINKIRARFKHVKETTHNQAKAYFAELDVDDWKVKLETLKEGDKITVSQDLCLADISMFTWKIGVRLKQIESLVSGNTITYIFMIESIRSPMNYINFIFPVDLTEVHKR